MLDSVSNGDRLKWDEYLEMNVVAFFNYLAFCMDRQRELKRKQSGIDKILNGDR